MNCAVYQPVQRESLPDAARPIRFPLPGPTPFAPRLHQFKVVRPEQRDIQAGPPILWGPRLIDYSPRIACSRGLYRVFGSAGYRFYWNNTRPPVTTDSPVESGILPHTTSATFANGTWYLSVSYFNGVLDSGFLPLGPHGETYIRIVIASGVAIPTAPSKPMGAHLQVRPAGVIRVLAFYAGISDGVNRATKWGITYTTDGSTPASGAASIRPPMSGSGLEVLSYDLPAQSDYTTVKVQLQTIRGTAYSDPGSVLSATAKSFTSATTISTSEWTGRIPGGGA